MFNGDKRKRLTSETLSLPPGPCRTLRVGLKSNSPGLTSSHKLPMLSLPPGLSLTRLVGFMSVRGSNSDCASTAATPNTGC